MFRNAGAVMTGAGMLFNRNPPKEFFEALTETEDEAEFARQAAVAAAESARQSNPMDPIRG